MTGSSCRMTGPHPRIIINNSPAALEKKSSVCVSYYNNYYYYDYDDYYYYYQKSVVETWSQISYGFLYGFFMKMIGKNTFMRFPPKSPCFHCFLRINRPHG
jgi:hypothetical protein